MHLSVEERCEAIEASCTDISDKKLAKATTRRVKASASCSAASRRSRTYRRRGVKVKGQGERWLTTNIRNCYTVNVDDRWVGSLLFQTCFRGRV